MFDQKKLNRVAALSLISSIEKVVKDKLKPGRMKNKMDRLAKLCVIPPISKSESYAIYAKIKEFEKISGWHGKEKHIGILINFCLILSEEYKLDKRIMETLNDIWEHNNNADPIPPGCDWGGEVAFEKWESIKY